MEKYLPEQGLKTHLELGWYAFVKGNLVTKWYDSKSEAEKADFAYRWNGENEEFEELATLEPKSGGKK